MELDKRILPGKRPLGCFDTETAKEFIGKQCYFSDDAIDFMDLDKADGDSSFYIAELQNIWTAEEYCFADNSNDYRFILPCEWVQSTEEQEQFAWDSLKLAGKLHYILHSQRYINWDSVSDDDFKIIAEIMAKHSREEKRFLRDVFERVLTYDEGRW